MEAEDLLIQVLEEFNLPVMLQGSMGEAEEYPESFFTFWNTESEETEHYNNTNHAEEASFEVNIYSCEPETVSANLREAKKKLKAVGFAVIDAGHSIMSDVETHTGKGFAVAIRTKQ